MKMMRKELRLYLVGPYIVLSLLCLSFSLLSESAKEDYWGFGDLEMFPIDPQIQLARSLDVNKDGLNDLVVSNPRKSELTLLINKPSEEMAVSNAVSSDDENINDLVNQFPPEARFKRHSILLQSRPKALVTGQLDKDDLPEIVYYDDRDSLSVLWNDQKGAWVEKLEWQIPNGLSGLKSLAIADLNMDSLPDIALLGEASLSILYNKGSRQFDRPYKIQIPAGVTSFDILDLNQDERLDLTFHIPNRRDGLFVSLKNQNSFGTFIQVKSAPMSKIQWHHDEARDELLMFAVSDHLDQVMAYTLNVKGASELSERTNDSILKMIQFPDFSGIKRGVAWADLNNDGLDDCLVSDPDAGLINVYLSNQENGWDQPRNFPSLTGVEELKVLDWGHDQRLEVFMLSKGENQVGHSTWDSKQQTLTYPEKLPSISKPLVIGAGKMTHTEYSRTLKVLHEIDGGWAITSISPKLPSKTQSFKGSFSGIPERLMIHDLDQDSLMDCLIFTPYEPLICLRQSSVHEYERIELTPPGGSWQGGWANIGDLDADGKLDLILPFKNMVRAFRMESQISSPEKGVSKTDWSLKVVEQINGPSNNSNLSSAVVFKSPATSESKVALFDSSGPRLHFAHQDSKKVWRVFESQDIPVSEFVGLQLIEHKRGKELQILCQGKSHAVVNSIGGEIPKLISIGKWRSRAKQPRFHSVISGDFDQNKNVEIFAFETSEHTVECLELKADHTISLLNQWSVFEKRSYRNQGAAFAEPKEGFIADFTGDGHLDLCLIVHDRVIIYPQHSWNGTISGN